MLKATIVAIRFFVSAAQRGEKPKGYGSFTIAVSPHGRIGSLFRRFLYGEDPMPLPDFCDTRPRAKEANRRFPQLLLWLCLAYER